MRGRLLPATLPAQRRLVQSACSTSFGPCSLYAPPGTVVDMLLLPLGKARGFPRPPSAFSLSAVFPSAPLFCGLHVLGCDADFVAVYHRAVVLSLDRIAYRVPTPHHCKHFCLNPIRSFVLGAFASCCQTGVALRLWQLVLLAEWPFPQHSSHCTVSRALRSA